jgi:hypothetical protein
VLQITASANCSIWPQEFCAHKRFPDGEIVTQGKICLWLSSDVLVRRKPYTKKEQRRLDKQQASGKASASSGQSRLDAGAEEWARGKGLTRQQLEELLQGDHFDPSVDHARGAPEEGAGLPGQLYGWPWAEQHVSAVAQLHSIQQTLDPSLPGFRGPALKALLAARRSQKDAIARENYADRGEGGVEAAYSYSEFGKMQEELLNSANSRAQVSRSPNESFHFSASLLSSSNSLPFGSRNEKISILFSNNISTVLYSFLAIEPFPPASYQLLCVLRHQGSSPPFGMKPLGSPIIYLSAYRCVLSSVLLTP